MTEPSAILLSGGMDSTALCALLKPQLAIFISYGQKCADAELQASSQICHELDIPFDPVFIECSSLGSGDLSGQPAISVAPASDWWPFRNQLLITAAATRAVSLNIQSLLIGTVRSDASHADGTPQFIEAMSKLLLLQEGRLDLCAPAIQLSTAELVKKSNIDISILHWTHSCHRGNFACGLCRGCNKHREVMIELGYETD